MTSPTPAVPEALQLAAEAKQSLSKALNSAEAIGYPLAGAMGIRRAKEDRDDARAAIDRLAALVQPPEAPAAPAGSELAKSPAGVVPWPEVAAYAGGAESGGVAAWLKVRLGDGPEATEFIRKDLAAPVAVEVSRLVEALRALMHARDFHPATRAKEDVVRQCADILATMTSAPAPQVPSEAARLVGGETAAALRTELRSLGYSDTAINAMGASATMMQRAIDAARTLARAQAAPTDAPGEPDMRLRNLQTWLVCREVGNALAPSLETVQGWLAALGDITGVAPPDFVMKAPKRDYSRCKFAAGGACCSSHCGDPACLASASPTATDAQGAGEAPKAVAAGEPTIIGLDYDGTITRDPDMWHAVMKLMQSRGHEVHIVTMRHGVESTMGHAPMEQRFLDDADGVHFTGNSETGDRDAKRPHMDAKGIGVHVWIDDNPKAVHMSARKIWGWCTNPGDPMIHSAPEAGSPTASTTAGLTEDQLEVLRFLWGAGNLRGCGFGTKPKEELGLYWWRAYLAKAFPNVRLDGGAAE